MDKTPLIGTKRLGNDPLKAVSDQHKILSMKIKDIQRVSISMRESQMVTRKDVDERPNDNTIIIKVPLRTLKTGNNGIRKRYAKFFHDLMDQLVGENLRSTKMESQDVVQEIENL